MKILHTSDWHLGMQLKMGTMIEDQRFFLDQLYRIIQEENVDCVIVAGDVFDTSVTNAEAIELYNEAVTRICIGLGRKMVVIAGNHDSGARLASCSELLKAAGLYVSGRLTRDIEPVILGNAAIYPVPFFGRDEAARWFPECSDLITSQEAAARVICSHIRQTMDPNAVNIIVSHAYIVDAELSDSDRAAKVGNATVIPASVFDGFDYAALGHIHKPQVITDTVRYSGTPIQYSFGAEEKQQKQVILFDTDTLEKKPIPLEQNHSRRSIQAAYAEIMRLDDCSNDYLRITVTDRIANLELLAELRVKFPFLLELYGMSSEATGEATAISADELEKMDEASILLRFLGELYPDYTPGEDQLKLFRECLQAGKKEEDLG